MQAVIEHVGIPVDPRSLCVSWVSSVRDADAIRMVVHSFRGVVV